MNLNLRGNLQGEPLGHSAQPFLSPKDQEKRMISMGAKTPRPNHEVMPAMKSRKNHMPPKIWPSGIFWKMTGRAWKPRLKAPPWAMIWVSARPKKTTAAGMAIVPPRMTSANSLVDEV